MNFLAIAVFASTLMLASFNPVPTNLEEGDLFEGDIKGIVTSSNFFSFKKTFFYESWDINYINYVN